MEFYTIAAETIGELVVKGSKFIAHVSPTATKAHAEDYVEQISAQYHDATHNCVAYKIGSGDAALIRFKDDGEPSGTAGRPILQAIEKKNLTNIVAVVTRYFGGTKLGTGGLIRAYGGAALEALNLAEIVKRTPKIILQITFSYELSNAVHQMLHKFDAQILESDFGENSGYVVELKTRDEAEFRMALRDVSSGKIRVA